MLGRTRSQCTSSIPSTPETPLSALTQSSSCHSPAYRIHEESPLKQESGRSEHDVEGSNQLLQVHTLATTGSRPHLFKYWV